jgi:hypothetical protein
MGELTIVTERPVEEEDLPNFGRSKGSKRHRQRQDRQPVAEQQIDVRNGNEAMVVHAQPEQATATATNGYDLAKAPSKPLIRGHNITPNIPASRGTPLLIPRTASSLLKGKSQPDRRVMFQDEVGVRRMHAEGSKTSQESKMNDRLAIVQELMSVTIRRPTYSSDSGSQDGSSDEESEQGSGLDEGLEEQALETGIPLNEDSGDDGDVEQEDEDLGDVEQDLQLGLDSPSQYEPEDSWRPRRPQPSHIVMEVDEEIFDSPTPSSTYPRIINGAGQLARRRSRIGSKCLTVVGTRRPSPIPEVESPYLQNTQGSVELGDSQRLAAVRGKLPSCIPETQLEDQHVELIDERSSQQPFVPQASYFERASQKLQLPVRKLNLERTKSMPASKHTPGLMAGGISMSDAFEHTLSGFSPRKSTTPLPTLLHETAAQKKSLITLTRRARIGLGSIPSSSVRRRQVSLLPFIPPFRR